MLKHSVHRVKPRMLANHISVVVVGCGGTGSAVLSSLPYLHHALLAAGHPSGLQVYAIDGDRISETNCVRQPFSSSEIGLYKVHQAIHENGWIRLAASLIGPVLLVIAIYLSYRFAERLARFLGQTAMNVIVRLAAFILLCIGVQIFTHGIHDLIAQYPSIK